jgi:hypothetical protein
MSQSVCFRTIYSFHFTIYRKHLEQLDASGPLILYIYIFTYKVNRVKRTQAKSKQKYFAGR